MATDNSKLKVLIAEDSDTDRFLLSSMVTDLGYQCLAVANGSEAVKAFGTYRPDIILLDVLMPSMDGLAAARAIKALAGELFVPIIFLTSLEEMEYIEACLDSGGDDFISKPVKLRILRAKMTAYARMQSLQNSLVAHRDQLRHHHEQLLAEQSVAKHVYDAITGRGSLDCGTLRYHMSSQALFNGDVLLASQRPNGNLMVLLGDFTGHGLPAALGAMPLATSFYSMVATGFSLGDIIRELNEKMHALLPTGFFCCATFVELDFNNRKLSVWNGGLPSGYFYMQEQRACVAINSTNLPLGVAVGNRFSNVCQQMDFGPEDRIFLWTDGIYDVQNARGEAFGKKRLENLITKQPLEKIGLLYDTIVTEVELHIGDDPINEDLSLVEILTRKPDGDELVSQLSSVNSGPLDWQFELEIRPPTFQSMDPIPMLMTLLSQVPGLGSKATSLFTVLTELYTNALDHGLLKMSSIEKDSQEGFDRYYQEREKRLSQLQAGFVRISLDLTSLDNSGRLLVQVEDSGEGFDFSQHPVEVNRLLHGRGIDMVRQFCQTLTYEGCGNVAKATYVWSLDS